MACVTLISDFGWQDASVAKVKGILMQHVPHLPVVDVSHQVPSFHLQQAAYLLYYSYRHFPPGSFHLPLVSLFNEEPTSLLIALRDNHYFLVPDNGILSLAFGNDIEDVWAAPTDSDCQYLSGWVHQAAQLMVSLQENKPEVLPLIPCKIKEACRHWLPKYDAVRDGIECHVMHVDNYGNVVLNLDKQTFDLYGQNRPFYIQLLSDDVISKFSEHYHQVAQGQKLCRFNSAGYLEIAINHASAAKLFGLKVYNEKSLMYNHIRVCFGEPPSNRILRAQLETLNLQ